MRLKLFSILLFSSLSVLKGDILFSENFSQDDVWPDGWLHEGENWYVGTNWQDPDSGYTPPGAVFEYRPRIYDYELHIQSPDIDVGDDDAVMVKFDLALNFWNASAHTNGLTIEYDGGNGWTEVLNYEIGPDAGFVEINFRTESFLADVDGGLLKIRWRAYGTDSWWIDAWVVDNVRVISLPKLSYVHIESNNEFDNQIAIEDDEVTLTFTSESTLAGLPYVQMNGNEINVDPQGGGSYQCLYVVQDMDEDGPVTFSIDFTDQNGIDGSTVKNTTDESRVVIDRTGPPPFAVGDVTSVGGNVFAGKWNSTNTDVELEVSVPQDSAVVDFNYYPGNSLLFDGSNDNVIIPGSNLYQFDSHFTIEAWIKPDSWSDYEGFLNYAMDAGESNQAGFGFVFFATGWRFYLKTENYDINYPSMVSASTPVGQWTHLAATYDGSVLKLYRNGSLVDNKSVTGNVSWGGAPAEVTLGAFARQGTAKYFDGNLDDVRFWSVVRTPFQIKGFRTTTLEGDEPGLVGYWKADTATGNVLYDQTTNGNNGVIDGAAWVTEDSPINFSEPVYDTGVIVGSTYQLRGRINTGDFEPFGAKDTVTAADFTATLKSVSASQESFEAIAGFAHTETASLSALLFDIAGNFSLGDTSTTTLEIDLVANDPDPVNITSNNVNSSSLAKTGDVVTITMSYDEDVNTPTVTLEGNAATVTDLGSEQFRADYELTGSEPEGIMDFLIEVTDYMGNPGDHNAVTDGSQVTYDRTLPTLSPVTIASSNSDPAWAKVDDVVSVTFTASENLSSRSATVVTQNATITDLGSDQFRADYTMVETDPEGETAFEILFSDLAGNDGDPVSSTSNSSRVIFDRTPPADFTVGTLIATGGNEVTDIWNLTNTGLDVNVPVANDTTLKNGTIQLQGKVGVNTYENLGSLAAITANDLNTDKVITVSGDLVEGLTGFTEGETIFIKATMTDRPGNSTEGSQSSTELLIDETPAGLAPISIISSNANSTLSRVGDDVTLTFTASEILTETAVIIAGQDAAVTDLGGNQFQAIYTMADGDPEGVVGFSISFTDVQGNPDDGIDTTSDESQVTFDNTLPTLNPVSITSNNAGVECAKIGDTVSVAFTSEESLLSWSAIIMDDSVDIIELGGNQYQADYELTDTDTDGSVSFLLQVVDLAGNISEDITTTTDNSDVIFDKTLPVLNMVHIESSNQYSTIAVPGDIVTLTFEGNESLSSVLVTISNDTCNVVENGGTFSATYTVLDSDSGGFIPFTIDYADCPGNPGETESTTTDESFVNIDVGPPDLASIKIFSSNQDSTWSKIGDTVIVRFIATEPLGASSLTIADQAIQVENPTSTIYQGGRVMISSDIEGIITFQISYSDLGGLSGQDTSSTTDNSSVRFDKTSPQFGSVSLVTDNVYSDSLAKLGDVATLNFSINEAHRSLVTTFDGNEIFPSQSGFNFSYNHTFSDSNNNGEIDLNILVVDSAGNQVDTSLNRLFFDKTNPSISNILEGSSEMDQAYSKYDDSLHLSWTAGDLESGPRQAFVAIGSDSGLADVVSWTVVENFNYGALTSISLTNNSTYYGAVHVEDMVGNMSDSLWGNGFTVDVSPPGTGIIWDGFYIEDVDYTADSTQLYARWIDFTDNQIIDHYEVALGSGDDTTNIIDWRAANQMDSVRIVGLNLEGEVQYHVYLRAVDGATNVSTVISTDGIEFDDQPPSIISISPEFDSLQVLSVLKPDTIQIKFNKPILTFSLDLVSTQDTAINYTLIAQDSGMVIALQDTLSSFETVSVFLDTALAFNLLNLSDTLLFRSEFWGDLDSNYQLEVEDVLLFNQRWPEGTDLGPVDGSVPYLRPMPDGEADLKDLAAFGKMWIWYYQDYIADSFLYAVRILPNQLKGIVQKNTLTLYIPPETHAGEITFFDASVSVNDIRLQQTKPSTFIFNVNDTLRQRMSFAFADKNGLDSILVFSVPESIDDKFRAAVSYRFLDGNAGELSQGIGELDLEVLPERFTVLQNYPNPFNAETVIHYEIPDSRPISIRIFNLLGREIRSVQYTEQKAGKQRFRWMGKNDLGEQVGSGVYFLQLSAGDEFKRMKMVLMK